MMHLLVRTERTTDMGDTAAERAWHLVVVNRTCCDMSTAP